MKSKKLLIILISSLFAVVALVSVFMLFTVKQVKADYTVSEQSQTADSVMSVLDKFVGSNLLLLDLEDVVSTVEENPYVEVFAISKKFPNVVEISVKERREVYVFDYLGKTYVANEDGFVLREVAEKDVSLVKSSRLLITVVFDGIHLTEVSVGDYIKSLDSDRIATSFDLAENAELTDCIDYMKISKTESTTSLVAGVKETTISFVTYTGVEIIIDDAEVLGKDKVDEAFAVYNGETNDYVKTYKKIKAYIDVDGVAIVWGTDEGWEQ